MCDTLEVYVPDIMLSLRCSYCFYLDFILSSRLLLNCVRHNVNIY